MTDKYIENMKSYNMGYEDGYKAGIREGYKKSVEFKEAALTLLQQKINEVENKDS